MSRLSALFRYQRDSFSLEASIEVDDALLVVVGPSGAGKSTLLRVLAGLERPAGGARLFLGAQDIGRLPAERRPFGYVAQSPALFPDDDVRGNVLFGTKRVPRGERVEAAETALALCGLEALASRRVASLSGGERQRVAFARALASRPRALLLDEPFSALDPSTRWWLCDFVRELRSRTKLPCVHVTHDAAEALHLGDALAIVANGRVGASVPIAPFLANPTSQPELVAHLLPEFGRHVEPLARLWNGAYPAKERP